MSEGRETSSDGSVSELALAAGRGVAIGRVSIASWGGECEVAVTWEAEVCGVQAHELFISLQERLEGLGLGGGEEESEGDEGGFHYFNLFQNR